MSIVTQKELTILTGFSDRTIVKRLKAVKPILSEDRRSKRYDTKDVLPILYGAGGNAGNSRDEKTRLLHHQANLAEIKELEAKRVLVPIEEVLAYYGDMITRCRSRLLPIGGLVSQKTGTNAGVKDAIDAEIREALKELSGQPLK